MAIDEMSKQDTTDIFKLMKINQEKNRTYKQIETLIFEQRQKQDKYYSKYKKALIFLCFVLIGTILKKKVRRHG